MRLNQEDQAMKTITRTQRISPDVIKLGQALDADLTTVFKLKRDGSLRKRDLKKCIWALAAKHQIDLRELAAAPAQ
jgi:hypothetical protein